MNFFKFAINDSQAITFLMRHFEGLTLDNVFPTDQYGAFIDRVKSGKEIGAMQIYRKRNHTALDESRFAVEVAKVLLKA